MQTLTESMGKITEDIEILLIFLKWNPKRSVFNEKNEMKVFILNS